MGWWYKIQAKPHWQYVRDGSWGSLTTWLPRQLMTEPVPHQVVKQDMSGLSGLLQKVRTQGDVLSRCRPGRAHTQLPPEIGRCGSRRMQEHHSQGSPPFLGPLHHWTLGVPPSSLSTDIFGNQEFVRWGWDQQSMGPTCRDCKLRLRAVCRAKLVIQVEPMGQIQA